MKRSALGLLAIALVLPVAATARSVRAPGPESFCGTSASTAAITYARHEFNKRRLKAERGDRFAVGQPGVQQAFTVSKQKNIAVIEDDGTIFPPPNLFDLLNLGVQFKRSGPGTRAEPFFAGVSDARGSMIQLGDDDSRAIDLPFSFTFYGVTYTRVFLNSDGNLTFTTPESASTARSLTRFLEGPPRIAVAFLDLDPSAASGGGAVYLLQEPGRVRITWEDVPRFGLSDNNTFQVTLYPNGRITMAWEGITATEAIVGVSPGGPGTITLLDLSEDLPINRKLDAIAEEFRDESRIDDQAAAKAVLSAVKDEYDMIVLFADFPVDLDGALAYHSPVKNTIRGIDPFGSFDLSSQFGSRGRLEGFVQMGSLSQYPRGPNNTLSPFDERTGIAILAHEVAHRWLAFARFRNDRGRVSTDLLGRQTAHWSFLMDSDGSVLEGNEIRDNGDGTFTTGAHHQGFSPLDLYLMGFRRSSEVPPFFYVTGSGLDASSAPDDGVIITGQRQNVSIGQVISAMGPRVPDFNGSQKRIQVAFALLGRQGEPPSLDSVKKVNQYRNRLSTYFRQQTDSRGRIATWLRLRRAPAAAAPVSVSATEPAAAPDPETASPPAGNEPPAPPLDLAERLERLAERTGS